MKKLFLMFVIVLITLSAIACNSQGDLPGEDNSVMKDDVQEISSKERKKLNLYLTALKAAFEEENGGNGFIAVNLDTLEGLSNEAKEEVLYNLIDLSANIYSFEQVKDDKTKFERDDDGGLKHAINGTLLYVKLEEYKDNEAIIEVTSWFGNLGAVFPKYKAIYENGKWHLKLLSMAIS